MSLSEEGSAPVSRSARTAQSPRHVRLPESRFFKSQMYCSTSPAIATHRHLPGRLPRWDVCGFSVRAALPRREGRRVVPFSAERWSLLRVRREASQSRSPWMLTALERSSICPNSGISGLAGHVSLAFTSLASSVSSLFFASGSRLMTPVVAAIAIAPSSAPVSLLNTLIQADAYAVTLLGYTLTGDGSLDFFHAGYALLLAFSSLIPLTAVSGFDCSVRRARTAHAIPQIGQSSSVHAARG